MWRDRHTAILRVVFSSAMAMAAAYPVGATAAAAGSSINSDLADVRQAERNGDWAAAESALNNLLREAPEDPRVLGEYGKLCLRTGRTANALDYLQRATRIDPKSWTMLTALGVAYDQAGDYAKAQESYAAALKIEPANVDLLSDSAISHARSGDTKTAMVLLKKAEQNGATKQQVAMVKAAIGKTQDGAAPAAAPRTAPPAPSAKPASSTPVRSGNYVVHAGAFSKPENAQKAASRLAELGARIVRTVRDSQDVSIVEFGPYQTLAAAQEAVARARVLGASALLVLKRNERTAEQR